MRPRRRGGAAWNAGIRILCIPAPVTPSVHSSTRGQIPGRVKEGLNGQSSAPPPLAAEVVTSLTGESHSLGRGVPTRTDLSMAAAVST